MTSTKKRIVVLISGNGSNLQSILDWAEAGQISGDVVGVVSNNAEAYGLTRAQNAGVAGVVVDHRLYESREDYDDVLKAEIDALQPDLVVLAGFMRILTEGFVAHYAGKMLNIHPSLLPKYKGLNTHQRAIDAEDDEHGASVHFVTPELDGGPVILQAKVPIFPEDSHSELAERVQQQERRIYPLVVSWFCKDRLIMQDNKAFLDEQALPAGGYASD